MSEQANGLVYGRAYFYHPLIGNGYRRIVIEEGRRWATICEPPTATVVKVLRAELPKIEIEPQPNWRRLARTMKRRLKAQKQWGQTPTKTAKMFCDKMASQ